MSLTSGASVGEIGEEVTVSWRRIDDGSGKISVHLVHRRKDTKDRRSIKMRILVLIMVTLNATI